MLHLETKNKAFIAAYKKGKNFAAYGLPISSNPYPDKKNSKGNVTYSRAFRRFWELGYMEGENYNYGFRLLKK